MTDQFSIENMKEELARALNKADEDAKTIAELESHLKNYRDFAIKYHSDYPDVGKCSCTDGSIFWCITEGYRGLELTNEDLHKLLTNNKPNIDFPTLLQDEAG